MANSSNPAKHRWYLPTLVGLAGLCALAGCEPGAVLTPQAAGLFSGKSDTGGNLDGNVSVAGSDVALLGQNFTGNAGQQVFVVIQDATTGHLLTQQAGFGLVDGGGNFQMNWKNLVVPGQALNVAFYADVNHDAICNAIPTDDAWEMTLKTLNDGTVVAVGPNLAQRSVCELFGSFALSFDSANGLSGNGYPNHNAYAAVVDMLDNSLVGEVQAAAIAGDGEVKFSWPGLLVTHHHYVLALCVDTADNGSCDTSAMYTFETGIASADVAIKLANATPVAARTFNQYWPQNITLPPPPAAAIPVLGGP